MKDAKSLERALGIKWNMRGQLHKAQGPLPLLQHGIWDIGDKFLHVRVHQRQIRVCDSLTQSIDALFEQIGPIIWPEPNIDRNDWLIDAKECTYGGLYSRNLYYSIDIDRGL